MKKLLVLFLAFASFATSVVADDLLDVIFRRDRSHNQKGERSVEPRPDKFVEAGIDHEYYHITKRAPASLGVGETFSWTYLVEVKDRHHDAHRYQDHHHQDLATIEVNDVIPSGFEYISSEPAAQVDGKKLKWVLKDMKAGEDKNIVVKLKASNVGDFGSCFTAHAIPQGCLVQSVGKAEISIEKSGPSEAIINEGFAYSVRVRNSGSMAARDVVVTDVLPNGLSHTGTGNLSWDLGTIEPNGSRELTVPVVGTKKGKFCNIAKVNTANAGSDQAEACTVILKPALAVSKTGTKKQFIGKHADYTITVENQGDVTLNNVVVTDNAPAGTRIVSASGGNINGNIASWNIGSLGAGKSKSFNLTLTSASPGNKCNTVTAATGYGLTRNAEACTEWIGVPAILLELVDVKDALLVGDTTTYVIRVTNQGSAPDRDVSLTLEFPKGIDPTTATGATTGKVSGKTVTFAPYTNFNPGQVIEFQVQAKASATGDNRVKAVLDSKMLSTDVVEIESTTVY